jgi:CheY-like chemotaxis protein
MEATVLVVDDQLSNRDLVRMVLSHHGYSVVEACSGAEALEVLAGSPADVVITDLVMPEMNGYDLALAMRSKESTRRIPVIFYTALYATETSRPAALAEAPVTRIVPKNGDLTRLLAAVTDALVDAGLRPIET